MAFFREWILGMFRIFGAIGIILGLLIFFLASPSIDLYETLQENNTIKQAIYNNLNLTNNSEFYDDTIMEDFCSENNKTEFCTIPKKTSGLMVSPIQGLIDKFLTPNMYETLTFLRTLSYVLWFIGMIFVFTGLKFDWRKLLIHLGIKNGIPLLIVSYIFYRFDRITPGGLSSYISQKIPELLPDTILNTIAIEFLAIIQQTIKPYFIASVIALAICIMAIILGYIFRFIYRRKLRSKN